LAVGTLPAVGPPPFAGQFSPSPCLPPGKARNRHAA